MGALIPANPLVAWFSEDLPLAEIFSSIKKAANPILGAAFSQTTHTFRQRLGFAGGYLQCFLTNIPIGILKADFSKKPLFLSGTK
ncbi:hypothetical protein AAE485_01795 [Acidithiobacillus ferriphilus]|uniref:hypothetical protein n=1 Tax=Acidithiobacillus ferriphilus TaxID=1689834 RepID=UPI002DBB3BB2|nr:hypothetical protein [Acidithiobacillus ferriphilus]MEB8535484.1 hypothetical protein [Acidithiobacillus ferriphilus]